MKVSTFACLRVECSPENNTFPTRSTMPNLVPVSLTNDANAAAIGEMMYGAAQGMKDFIMITLGTGVGSGIVANGHLIYGHDGFAGELGHTTIIPGGRVHKGTGLHGSLEAYASATGVTATAIEFLERDAKQNNGFR